VTDRAAITALMAEIGRTMDLARVLAYEEAGTWELDFDERTTLLVDLTAPHDMLVISGTVAKPHPERAADYHRLLLEYNHQWRETGGLRMALEPTEGEAVLLYEMPAEPLETGRLATVLGNFHQTLMAWRAALESAGAGGSGRIEPDGGDAFFVRA
jgi:hypothetical protein